MNDKGWLVLLTVALVFLGGILGAYAVLYLTDVKPSALPWYFSVLQLVGGGSIGVMTGIYFDRRSDRRKVRRKIELARLKIARLIATWAALEVLFNDTASQWTPSSNLQMLADSPMKGHIRDLLGSIGEAAKDRPDFEDLIETEDDRLFAQKVLHVFDTSKLLAEDDRNVILKADIARRERRAAICMRELNSAYNHFGGRL